jgi:hypothetical protein
VLRVPRREPTVLPVILADRFSEFLRGHWAFSDDGPTKKGHVRRAGDGHSDAETHGDISGIALLARLTKVAEGHSDRTTA